MAGLNLEPFPRQVLIGRQGALMSYPSEVYDLKDYRTVVYVMETYASIPANLSPPVLMFLECGNDAQEPGEDLIPGGTGPVVGSTVTGSVVLTGRYLRVRVDVQASETTSFFVRLVARSA